MKDEHHAYSRALGQYIAFLRKLHGMTQADLAKALNVSQQTVFAYELGDRRVVLSMAVKMARVFTISVDELAGATKPAHLARLRTSAAAAREMEQLKRLSKTQRRFVRRIVEVFLDRLEPPSAPKLQFQFPKVPTTPSRKRSTDESAIAAGPSVPR